jgi:predicted secreted protein
MAPLCALAAEPAKPQGTVIDLSAEASRAAPNDMARATAYVEAGDASPAELAKRVNGAIAAALQTAKSYPAVKTRSGGTSTYPNHGKDGRITGWRMRSELLLESRDMTALSELIGKLQTNLAVGNLMLMPAPETRKKAEDDAMLDAIAAFQSKAKLAAGALGKPYRVRQLNIGQAGQPPVVAFVRSARVGAAEAAPAPIEAGESNVSVSVSGQIELSE